MATGVILGQDSPLKTVFGQEPNLEGDVSPTAEQMNVLSTNGGTMEGEINMNNFNIVNLPPEPRTRTSPVTPAYLDFHYFDPIGQLPTKREALKISKGGTGADNAKDAKANLGIKLLDNASIPTKTTLPSKTAKNVASMKITESGIYLVFAFVALTNTFPDDIRLDIQSESGTRLAVDRNTGNTKGISCNGLVELAGNQTIHANVQQYSGSSQTTERVIFKAVKLF